MVKKTPPKQKTNPGEAVLRESDERYRLFQGILRSSSDGILVVNRENEVLYANERFVEMWMIPQEIMAKQDDTLLLQHVLDQLSDPQDFLQKVQELYNSADESFDTLYFKDGRVFDRLSRPMLQEMELRGRVWSFRDITERVGAEMERQVLLEIMQGLVTTQDLKDFLRLVHHSIAKVVYAENFFVLLYNKDTDLFEEVYSVDKFDLPGPPARLKKSTSSYVFRSGQPFLSTQARFDELVMQGEVELVGTNSPSWLGVPLRTSSETIGVMVVQDYDHPNRYSERDTEFLFSIAGQVALAIERKHAEEELRRAKDELETTNLELQQSMEREKLMACTDGLTGLYNHRYIFELAAREFQAAVRHRRPLTFLMFDMDDFKQVNDTLGHTAGDKLLAMVAQTVVAQVRASDVVARYGGDEFIVMLPQASAQQALPIAERIRAGVAAIRVDAFRDDKEPFVITLSMGIAEMWHEPVDGNVERVIQRADEAMYKAKQSGRNRIVVFGRDETGAT